MILTSHLKDPYYCNQEFIEYNTSFAATHTNLGQYTLFRLQGKNFWNGTALSQPFTLSSVVFVLISVTTDMSPTGDLLVTSIFAGEVSS